MLQTICHPWVVGWFTSWLCCERLGKIIILFYFLGIEVIPCSRGVLLSQHRYILDLLKRTKMLEAKPVNSPIASSTHFSAFEGDYFLIQHCWGFEYLSITRPDISFCVNILSQLMHKPADLHWQSVKRLLRYFKQIVLYVFFLQIISFHGAASNNKLLLDLARKLNTKPLQTLLLSFLGFSHYVLNLDYGSHGLQPCGVTA